MRRAVAPSQARRLQHLLVAFGIGALKVAQGRGVQAHLAARAGGGAGLALGRFLLTSPMELICLIHQMKIFFKNIK